MKKEYFDINGTKLEDGDRVVTIRLNGKAVGGDLVKAFFRLDEKGSGFLASTMEETYNYHFYKRNFDCKVLKI